MSAADATQPTLREVERRRASAELDRKRLDAEARATAGQTGALHRRLSETAARRAAAAAEAHALESDAARLLREERDADAEARHARARYERAIAALAHPAARQPQAAAVAAVTGRSMAQRATLAARAADQARTRRHDVAARRADLAVTQARIDSDSVGLRVALAEKERKQALLIAEKSRTEAALAVLARQARNLRELVARAAPARRRAAPATPPAPGAAASSRAVLTRFTSTPATVAQRFGERRPGGATQGLTLRTRPGAQVLAPAAGKVAYCGPFRSYGIVLILDLDNDYAVVLTGMNSVSADVGQRVRAGQAIAAMAPDGDAAQELYVEVRQDGQPVDPARWLGADG
ncbi:MAG: peptidoglycan DD-metalloendopeptidase family protein [Hyphomonadaceae bacterium]|nr:peptidoglycan DD-metalloendopeptidase family protein [Hyphomonadaceae bacterium]